MRTLMGKRSWPKNDPPVLYPFYTRNDWRQDEARLRRVIRFVPEDELDW